MHYALWLALGIVAVMPLICFAEKLKYPTAIKLLGRSLIIAAIIYIGFAFVWGDTRWLLVEAVGVAAYGLFYWLAIKGGGLWLALGWLLHPVWDIAVHMAGPGVHVVPEWYALACVSFDFAVAIYIVRRVQKQARAAVG